MTRTFLFLGYRNKGLFLSCSAAAVLLAWCACACYGGYHDHPAHPPKRWRPRFSVRMLVVLVSLVCGYFGLWEATKGRGVRDVATRMTKHLRDNRAVQQRLYLQENRPNRSFSILCRPQAKRRAYGGLLLVHRLRRQTAGCAIAALVRILPTQL